MQLNFCKVTRQTAHSEISVCRSRKEGFIELAPKYNGIKALLINK